MDIITGRAPPSHEPVFNNPSRVTSANSLKTGAAREAFCESRKSSWNALHDFSSDDHILTVALPLVMLTKIRETLAIELTAFCSSTSSPCAGSVRYLPKT